MDSSDLRRKAKWHEDRAGTRASPAGLERSAQMNYRAELAERGQDAPSGGLVKARFMGGQRVEPEYRTRAGRPSPKEFAWR